MKVHLVRPLAQKVSISNPVLVDRGHGQMRFISASRVGDAPSAAYKQQFARWQREERGN